MSKQIYDQYKNILPVTNDAIVTAIQLQVTKLTKKQAFEYRASDPIGGTVYIFTDGDYPGYVLEIVPGTIAEDSVSTLYKEHPIFNSRTGLMKARREMIEAIAKPLLAVPGTLAIPDEGRERDVTLAEHGTAQLIDQMQRMFQ